MTNKKTNFPKLATIPGTKKSLRRILDLLIVFCLLTQVLLVMVLMAAQDEVQAVAVSAGAVIAMGLLTWFYTKWLFPVLDTKQVLAILAMKEMALIVIFSLVIGLVFAIEYIEYLVSP